MIPVSSEEKVKRAALKEFAMYGFEGARIDRIARKARINKAMIYYHFKNKESLYESVLAGIYNTARHRVIETVPKDKTPEEQLESIISAFIFFLKELDQDYVRMMLREISSGGRYFKKLMLPNVILPLLEIVQDIFNEGTRRGMFKNLIPHITFIQILGAIIFSNAIRITLADTDVGKLIFQEDFFDKFRTNLLSILETGIRAR
jgi:TetR/AcrR family transcriptional regulator